MISFVNIHIVNPMGEFRSAAGALVPGFAGKQSKQDHTRHRNTDRDANQSAKNVVAHSNVSVNAPRGVR